MILYRPVGQAEYELIAQSEFTAYPPRLPEQPIFYPVLNEQYAREIAEKWNRRYPDSQYTGYVTTFEIDEIIELEPTKLPPPPEVTEPEVAEEIDGEEPEQLTLFEE